MLECNTKETWFNDQIPEHHVIEILKYKKPGNTIPKTNIAGPYRWCSYVRGSMKPFQNDIREKAEYDNTGMTEEKEKENHGLVPCTA